MKNVIMIAIALIASISWASAPAYFDEERVALSVNDARADGRYAAMAEWFGVNGNILKTANACVEDLPVGADGKFRWGSAMDKPYSWPSVTREESAKMPGVKFDLGGGWFLHAQKGCKGNAILFYGQLQKVGPAGRDGKDGCDGQDGHDGQNGTNGLNGRDGKDGRDGQDGFNGRDGVTRVVYFYTIVGNQQPLFGPCPAPSPYAFSSGPGAAPMGGFPSYNGGTRFNITAEGGSGGNANAENNTDVDVANTNTNNLGANVGDGELWQETNGESTAK